MTRFNILTDSQVKSTRVELLMFTLAVVVVDWATKALAVVSVGGLKHVPLSGDIYSGLAIFPQIQDGWVGLCVVQHQVSSGGALMSGLSLAGFALLAFFLRAPCPSPRQMDQTPDCGDVRLSYWRWPGQLSGRASDAGRCRLDWTSAAASRR